MSHLAALVRRRRYLAPWPLILGLVVALALAVGVGKRALDAEKAYVPFFLPVYEIETVSGDHVGSLLNLPMPNVGAPQVPMPVDVNGDLLPDVTAAVNLINAQGIFNNPPNVGELIAPNIEFLRLFTAPILTPGGDPLKINIKFTVYDLEGEQPDIVVRYGYETGPGGSIPPKYKAVVGGIDDLFDPLVAKIDTNGGYLLGLDPRLDDLGLGPAASAYRGPLTTFASLDMGPDLNAQADLRFEEQPELIEVSYGGWQDGDGQEITFAHGSRDDVDLHAKAHVVAGDLEADAEVDIDRLPNEIAISLPSNEQGGGLEWASSTRADRLPDLSARLSLLGVFGDRPLNARVDLESIPRQMSASWAVAPGLPPSASFSASEEGIGAIDARVWNYDGESTAFTPWVPDQRQHASIQVGGSDVLDDETLIQARLERIRAVDILSDENGAIAGNVEVGDGARPLQVHGEIDLRSLTTEDGMKLPYADVTALISPLPDDMDFSIVPGVQGSEEPLSFSFDTSATMDLDLEALVGLAGDEGDPVAKADPGTAYANARLRNVPTSIDARMLSTELEQRIEVDAVPRDGAAPLDAFADVVIGSPGSDGTGLGSLLAEPIHASLSAEGLPRYLRVQVLERPVEDPDDPEAKTLERLTVRSCDVDFATYECEPGTDEPTDELAVVEVEVRNFEESERPAGVPAPPASGPLYVTLVADGPADFGDLDTEPTYFEVTGRVTDIRELSFLSTPTLMGGRVDIGDGKDFRTFIDADNIHIDDAHRIDVDGDIRLRSLPSPLSFCVSQNGHERTGTPYDAGITGPCEVTDPFGDGTADGPMTIAYRAPGPFDVTADLEVRGTLPFLDALGELPIDLGDGFDRVAANLELLDIPGELTAVIQSPAESEVADDEGSTSSLLRVLTDAPGASNTTLDLGVELTSENADCRMPDPDGSAICADIGIHELPEHVSVLYAAETTGEGDDAETHTHAEAHTCNRDFFGTGECEPGTEGSIGEIEVDVRAHAGNPDGILPAYVPPADEHYLYALGRLVDLGNFDLRAGLRIEDLRSVVFDQDSNGLEVFSDVGDGVDPLTIHGYADLREAVDIVPELLLAEIEADVVIDPLPQQISVDMDRTVQADGDDIVGDEIAITAEASQAAVVTVDAELREAGVPDGAPCGERGTYCAQVEIDDLPQLFEAVLDREFGEVVDGQQRNDMFVHVDQERFAADADKADIHVSAQVGLPIELPLLGHGPIYADLSLLGVPDKLSVAIESMDQVEVDGDDVTTVGKSLERIQVHTCDRDFENEACVGDEDQLDEIVASVRTVPKRPTNFPTPDEDGAPLRVEVAGRGTQLEAFVQLTSLREFQFLNRDGLTAATARLGDTEPFAVDVDIEGLPVGELVDLGDLGVEDPVLDVKANVDITPFPGELSFCMREGGLVPVPAPSGIPFTAVCEDTDPFNSGDPLVQTPMSIGFDANSGFDLHVDAAVATNGIEAGSDPAVPIEEHRFEGSLDITDIPSDITFHFLTPRETEIETADGPTTVAVGPFRGLVETPDASGIDLQFYGAMLIGEDTVCEDPRPNREAICVSGQIVDLPTEVEFFYDPSLDLTDPDVDLTDPADTTNFVFRTDGDAPTQINDLRVFASTFGALADQIPEIDPLPGIGQISTDILLLEADLGDLPQPFDLRGTLALDGDAPTIDLAVAGGLAIPTSEIHARNFIAPDPTADAFPLPNRPVADDPGLTEYPISVIQRGEFARLDAELPGLQGVTLRPVRSNTDRAALGTYEIGADFGEEDFNLRTYVDLASQPGERILGDILIGDIPTAITGCIRTERPEGYEGHSPVPGTGTWCDTDPSIEAGDSAIEIAQAPNTLGRTLDVDAFARLETNGGATVIAGRVDIDDVPQIVRGRFGDNGLDVSGHSRVGGTGMVVPDGIDKIAFEAATFDLDDDKTGYAAGQVPYSPVRNNNKPFPAEPAPADGREFVHAAADLSGGANLDSLAFHVHGQIGGAPGTAQLQRVMYSKLACEEQTGAPDFPRLPSAEDDGTQHSCIYVDFDDDGEDNPLSLDATLLLPGGITLDLHDAGISDIPSWIQVNLADAEKFTDPENQRGWRRPCPPAADTGDTDPCMAPLVRFDQPANTFLFGVVDISTGPDAPVLASIAPKGTAPNFGATPNDQGWDANPFGGGLNPDQGIILKGAVFDGGDLTGADTSRIAARAAFRLPIPRSLTIDQVQTYSGDAQDKLSDGTPTAGNKADDFRFRAVIRNGAGQVIDHLGQLAAMFHKVGSGAQVLLTNACAEDVVDAEASEPKTCGEYDEGISLPGEVAMTLYLRTNLSEAGEHLRESQFIQADGRISTPMHVGARVYGGGAEVTDGISIGTAEVSVRNVPAHTGGAHAHEPSFRLRAEIISDGDKPEEPPPSNGGSGEATVEADNSDPELAWVEFNSQISIGMQQAYVGFDFAPTGTPARRLDATIFIGKGIGGKVPKLGVDIDGYSTIGGATPNAPVSAGAHVRIDPLDVSIQSKFNVGAKAQDLLDTFLEETLGLPDWLSAIISFITKPITAALDAFLNLFKLGVELDSDLSLQFEVDRLHSFTLRNNLLHLQMDGDGHPDGSARLGPINWYVDQFWAGAVFQMPSIKIPKAICWVPGVPCRINFPPVSLLTYSMNAGIPTGSFGVPILISFRECGWSGLGGLMPFSGGVNSVRMVPDGTLPIPNQQVDSGEDFMMWIGDDPRMSLNGLLLHIIPVLGSVPGALDWLIDLLVGPIICHVGDFGFDGILTNNIATTDPATYNPGNPAAMADGSGTPAFPGHPVPGQPGVDPILPEEIDPTGEPVVDPPDTVDPVPVVDPPPVPPSALDPLYSGPDVVIDGASPVALCGVHEMNSLVIDREVTVATTADASDLIGTGEACPAGDEGTLELLANTIEVTEDGSIDATGITTDVPDLGPATAFYRATGSSGGTSAGAGGIGSAPNTAFQNYQDADTDAFVYPGGPGSSVGNDFDLQSIAPDVAEPDTVDSAGPGGAGGGAVILRADTLLSVAGDITADGANGASNTAGECDANPDDFNGPGIQDYDHDNDPDTPDVPRPVVDPDWEHVSGFIGSGGGAGGGIALQARHEVAVTGTLSARGGNGGSGVLGAGGGGGGGAVKVIAPITNVSQATVNSAVTAGVNGNSGILCDGIPVPDNAPEVYDPGTTPPPPNVGEDLPRNGAGVVYREPWAQLQPYGDFWWPAGDLEAYYVGAGSASPSSTITTCAVYAPPGALYDHDLDGGTAKIPLPRESTAIAGLFSTVLPRIDHDGDGNPVPIGTVPTAGNPCGTIGENPYSIDGVSIRTVDSDSFSGSVTDPTTVVLDDDGTASLDDSGLYGLYTTAVRSGVVEELGGIEWGIGIDAAVPTVTLDDTPPGDDPLQAVTGRVFTIGAAKVVFDAADQADLSGLRRTECRVGAGDWLPCGNGQAVALLQPDGQKTISVRAIDEAGNVSATDSVTVWLDQNAPEAQASLSGGVQGGDNWYREPPSATIHSWSGSSPQPAAPDPAYVWSLDRGAETGCNDPCEVASSEIGQLKSGEHFVRYTAINRAGLRHDDNANDGTLPSPMPRLNFKFDPQPPAVALATVPAAPTQEFGGNDWFDVRPYLVVSAVDEFGGSGVASVQYGFDCPADLDDMDPGDWEDMDLDNPPQAPNGVSTFCYRALDVAGNETVGGPITLRVDGAAPTYAFTRDSMPNSSGWYTTAPSLTIDSYDDVPGVGIAADHFRVRVDNDLGRYCDDPGCQIPTSRLDTTGRYLAHGTAQDRFGNRAGEVTFEVDVDLEAPVVLPIISPAEPDGENGWYHERPWLQLFVDDPGDGSGVASVEYSLDGGSTYQAYTEPVYVVAGEHTLCWRAEDNAGNELAEQCRSLWVDLDDPEADLTDTPTAWVTADQVLTASASDDLPGSGLGTDPSDVCEDLYPEPAATGLSGLCVSADGGPFVPVTGNITVSEGIHDVRAYSVDRSGRRSPVVQRILRIDQSGPNVEVRLQPPEPARNDWYRRDALAVLRATDGQDGSGVQSLEYRLDGGAWTAYTEPVLIGEGVHTIDARATDMVNQSQVGQPVRVDSTMPFVRATSPSKSPWIRFNGTLSLLQKLLLGTEIINVGATNNLRFQVADNLSGPVETEVVIFDVLGNPVRVLEGPTVDVTPGADPVGAHVVWDGKDNTLLDLVPVGIYYYRVVATDEAGNTAYSGESKITIRLL